ncbi:MAG: hypothetical protein AAFU70_13625, partial [Planctomycetota bacterium]
ENPTRLRQTQGVSGFGAAQAAPNPFADLPPALAARLEAIELDTEENALLLAALIGVTEFTMRAISAQLSEAMAGSQSSQPQLLGGSDALVDQTVSTMRQGMIDESPLDPSEAGRLIDRARQSVASGELPDATLLVPVSRAMISAMLDGAGQFELEPPTLESVLASVFNISESEAADYIASAGN